MPSARMGSGRSIPPVEKDSLNQARDADHHEVGKQHADEHVERGRQGCPGQIELTRVTTPGRRASRCRIVTGDCEPRHSIVEDSQRQGREEGVVEQQRDRRDRLCALKPHRPEELRGQPRDELIDEPRGVRVGGDSETVFPEPSLGQEVVDRERALGGLRRVVGNG